MLADRVDETVGMEHREPFRVRVTMIPSFAGAVELHKRDGWEGGHVREFFAFTVKGKVEYDCRHRWEPVGMV
jgi:hypothetical protein